MALALLDLLGLDATRARLRIDTGTNRYYQLTLGLAQGERSGFPWIDEVVHKTPITVNPRGGGQLDTSTELSVSLRGLVPSVPGRGRITTGLPPRQLFAQLFSFKSADGRGPGFSPVLALDGAMTMPGATYQDPGLAMTLRAGVGGAGLCPPRAIACRTCSEQLSEPRLDDLLAQIVRVAAPVVLRMLGTSGAGAGTPAAPGASNGGGSPAAPSGGNGGGPSAGLLGPLVQAIAAALPGLVGQLGSAPLTVAQSQSTLLTPHAGRGENRFAGRQPLSRPMIFGIDDAIIGSVIGQVAGPVLQVLPQLLNSANQQRLQMEQSRNHMVSDLVGQVERRMLLQQVLAAQPQANPSQAADLQRLADLLQQAGAGQGDGAATPASTAPAATTPTTAAGSSLSLSMASAPPVSARAVTSFITGPALTFPGGDQVLFARGRDVTLQVKLAIGDPVPAHPLPKAIIRVVIKDPDDQRVLAEKVVKQHDLAANATVAVPFTAQQIAAVPAGKPVSMLAEIRWRLTTGNERKALGAQDAVFVDRLFVKSRGDQAGPERELTDMGRYRPFWNKIWESPAIGQDKTLWGLDVTMKYTALLTAEHAANGIMQTRLSAAADAASDDLRLQTSGRMKAGIESSVDELAKLAVLWDGEPVLDADHLSAFRSDGFASQNASDAIVAVKLEGPRGERGLVWVVPILQLVDYTLGAVKTVDDRGQVTAVQDEHAHFPLPVAIRILALRAGEGSDAASPGDGPDYHFDGYRIDHSERVVLTPHG